jgi:hypothetical protein
MKARIAASLILALPALAAIYGSATSLTAIATEDRVTSPWTLPFCLDVLALGVVVTSIMIPSSHWLRRVTPWLCYAGSAALQVSGAWLLGPRAWGTHAAGLAAAAIGSHLILDLWRPVEVPDAPKEVPVHGHFPEPATVPNGTVDPPPEPTVAGATVPAPPPETTPVPPAPVEVPPTPLRRPPVRKQPVRPAATSLERLVAKAEKVAEKRGVPAVELSQRQIMGELKIGSPRAAEVARALRDRRPLELASTNGARP